MAERYSLEELPSETDLQRLAEESGCELLLPDDHTIQLDLDDGYSQKVLDNGLEIIRQTMKANVVDDYRSKGGGRHVIISTSLPLSDFERIAIQAFLGSDPKREALAWRRLKLGFPHPQMLFKPLDRE